MIVSVELKSGKTLEANKTKYPIGAKLQSEVTN